MTLLETSKAYRFEPIVTMTRECCSPVGRERSGSGLPEKGTTFSAMVTYCTSQFWRHRFLLPTREQSTR
jgi:hypothetical protein